jgi:hypothetical protein
MIFWDTSALVAAYLREDPGHARARSLLTGKDVSSASTLLRTEAVAAVVRRLGADRRLGQAVLALVRGQLRAFVLVPVSADVLARAERLILRHRLRGADAVHLASALESRALLGRAGLRFATSDGEQAAAARAEGLRVLDPSG